MATMPQWQAASHLFTLRVWQEDVGNGRSQLRGTLTHVLTGKTGYSRDWATLVRLIEPFVAPTTPAQILPELEETSHDDLCF
jgi:hypothetical protein